MTASINEPFLVGDPFVMEISGRYHMWYIFGTKWEMNLMLGFRNAFIKLGIQHPLMELVGKEELGTNHRR